tara:strand:+ start:385 stop:513 length:129 start_codon:yes stop_codon:yes gene_type:complete
MIQNCLAYENDQQMISKIMKFTIEESSLKLLKAIKITEKILS